MKEKNKRLLPTLMAAPVGGALAALFTLSHDRSGRTSLPDPVPVSSPTCDYTLQRVHGYRYARPLFSAEPACESQEYAALKQRLDSAVNTFRAQGTLARASVYVRDLSSGTWMSYNDTASYMPGSMLKLPVMIAWLRTAEEQPGTLDRKFAFTGRGVNWPTPEFPPAREVQEGQPYSVRDLLGRMIVDSDNKATSVLTRNMTPSTFMAIFSELGLQRPSESQAAYPMKAREYATFWKALYNGGLLRPSHDEFALDLLSQSRFVPGFRQGIGNEVLLASKFGEAGTEGAKQLHESGIVYLKDRPYLITVMTDGPEMQQLPPVLATLARIVHHHMSAA